MTDHQNPITQKYLELEQQLSFELTAFSQNVSALQAAPTQDQYDRFCGHLNYIQLLLSDADRITRSLPLDRNDPSFYKLLEAKDRVREHGITYASLRGSFFQQYSREEELDESLERVLTQEEMHPEIQDIMSSQEDDLASDAAPEPSDEDLLSDSAEPEAEENAKALAAKKKKRQADQRRLEELRRRQLLEQELREESLRRAQNQTDYHSQMAQQEQQREAYQTQELSDAQARADIRSESMPTEPERHMPEPAVSHNATFAAEDHPASQPEGLHKDEASLQRARWEELSRLGIHQDPSREISQAQLAQERLLQEEDRVRAEMAEKTASRTA